jgi:di/tricarboxylate transporter
LAPQNEDVLHAGDFLLLAGREDRVSLLLSEGVKIGRTNTLNGGIHEPSVALVEVIVAPHSQAEGYSLKDLNFRKKFGITAVALWREGRSYRTDVGTFKLRFGDAFLMVGPPERFDILRSEPDFLLLEGTMPAVQKTRRAPLAMAITVMVLVIAALGAPVAETMLLGAVLMVLTGCLTMDDSYRAIEWKAIFLIAGMLPISLAMRDTGLAAAIAQTIVGVLGPLGNLAVIGGLYVLTVLLTQVMSGQVTALILAPIAIQTAVQLGSSPQAAAIAVAIGCSTCFLTPISHPVNILIMGPGGYTFGDFFKVGWILTVVSFIALLIALPLFWKL